MSYGVFKVDNFIYSRYSWRVFGERCRRRNDNSKIQGYVYKISFSSDFPRLVFLPDIAQENAAKPLRPVNYPVGKPLEVFQNVYAVFNYVIFIHILYHIIEIKSHNHIYLNLPSPSSSSSSWSRSYMLAVGDFLD